MSRDDLKPDDRIIIVGGPYKGALGKIVSLDGNGTSVQVVVQKEGQLTPPVPIERSDFKKDLRSGFWVLPWGLKIVWATMIVFIIATIMTHSVVAIAVSLACMAIMAGCLVWYGRQSRRLKTCPECRGKLDPDKWYSQCLSCGWRRPMPMFHSKP